MSAEHWSLRAATSSGLLDSRQPSSTEIPCGCELLLAPLAAEVQPSGPVRIGWLSPAPHPFIAAFRAGLKDLSYVEGQSVVIEERYAEGQLDRLPGSARELMARHVDVFVTSSQRAMRNIAERGRGAVKDPGLDTSRFSLMGPARSEAHAEARVAGDSGDL